MDTEAKGQRPEPAHAAINRQPTVASTNMTFLVGEHDINPYLVVARLHLEAIHMPGRPFEVDSKESCRQSKKDKGNGGPYDPWVFSSGKYNSAGETRWNEKADKDAQLF